jgi:hypothetical protein
VLTYFSGIIEADQSCDLFSCHKINGDPSRRHRVYAQIGHNFGTFRLRAALPGMSVGLVLLIVLIVILLGGLGGPWNTAGPFYGTGYYGGGGLGLILVIVLILVLLGRL